MKRSRILPAIALAATAGAGACTLAGEGPAPGHRKSAVLVGCTRYPSLPAHLQLEGPANDVALMRRLLIDCYQFRCEDIVTLAEPEAGGQRLPTRENIRRELERLAKEAAAGDLIAILLSGHGSQQPDQQPPDPDDPEPDGLDEIFLPRDIGTWDGPRATVANAIIDDELGAWLKAIRDKGAMIWLIVDSCHSGTIIRGNDAERLREVRPDGLGIPGTALNQARERAARGGERNRGEASEPSAFELPGGGAGLVAIYAAQAREPAPELPLPIGAAQRKYHGLLTYTISEILTPPAAGDRPGGPASALTYRQLIQRIHARYSVLDRTFPTPLIEGAEQDRPVLGQGDPIRSRIALRKDPQGGWTINAGRLHGLRPGTILAVYPPGGADANAQPAGYVRIAEEGLRPLEAAVEPCAYDNRPERRNLPEGGPCRVVLLVYSDLQRTVAVDRGDHQGRPIAAEDRSRLIEVLRRLEQQYIREARQAAAASAADTKPGGPPEGTSLIRVLDDPAEAQWLLRIHPAGSGRLYLVPGAGWPTDAARYGLPPVFGPVPEGEAMLPWLKERLARIVGAENLKQVAQETAQAGGGGVRVEVEMLRFASRTDRKGQVVDLTRGIELHPGEIVGFRLSNPDPDPVDVTLLFLDGAFGVAPIFPAQAGSDNRLDGHQSVMTRQFRVNAETMGSECLVSIAVRGKDGAERADFGPFAQARVELARDAGERKRGPGERNRGIDSPLGMVLQWARFGVGRTRGLGFADLGDYGMQLLPWRTVPNPRPAAGK
jgi:hypothetical protein